MPHVANGGTTTTIKGGGIGNGIHDLGLSVPCTLPFPIVATVPSDC